MQHNSIYIDSIVQNMNKHCDQLTNTRGRRPTPYETIAKAWDQEVRRAVMYLSFTDNGKTYLPTSQIRQLFNYRYKTSSGSLYWFDWFHQNYPLWKEIKRGYSIGGKGMATEIELVINELEYFENLPEGGHFETYVKETIEPFFFNNTGSDYDLIYQAYDKKGLDEYIKSTTHSSTTTKGAMRETLLRNLTLALKIRSITDPSMTTQTESINGKVIERAYFPVITHKSSFGRTYHKGINLQNAHRELRRALLSGTYNIDIEASVYGFYDFLCRNVFDIPVPNALNIMIEDKAAFRKQLAMETLNELDISDDYKIKMVKEALTALGFGARTANAGAKPTAMQDIIRSSDARKKFLEHKYVKQLVELVKNLTESVREMYKTDAEFKDMIQSNSELYNPTQKRINYKQVLAYLYQQYESSLRAELIECAEVDHKGTVILQTHDGIYVNDLINTSDIKINLQHRLEQINPRVKVSVEKQDMYRSKLLPEQLNEIDQHKKQMSEFERQAQQYMKTKTKTDNVEMLNKQLDSKLFEEKMGKLSSDELELWITQQMNKPGIQLVLEDDKLQFKKETITCQ